MITVIRNGKPADLTATEIAEIEAANAAAAAAARVPDIKAEAARRILSVMPDWKQRNLTARAAELVEAMATGGSLTPEDEQERQQIKAIWAWVKAVRAESDRLEAAGLTAADGVWPGAPM